MSILYILLVISYLFITYIITTHTFTHVINSKSPKSLLLGNYSDLIVDIDEDILLECDQSNNTKSFEWFRKEKNWFNEESPEQRIPYNEQYLLVNENKVSTILYKCITTEYSGNYLIKSYKLYVDRLPKRQRDIRKRCLPPKCKPYATVWEAKCDRVVLNLTYPHSQHGYNSSTKVWGNILCDDEIGGFQIWVVGYGILKRFLPQDTIVIEKLTPGKTYCFNGWAYNSCGAGPVFTLEGVCAENVFDCQTQSTEHCEYDYNY
ncbi:uncharacterized protein LOC128963606, partial [Oppia nitens]|uniref:uncharacterized protein LOC128963606 n=1 Tax=Oppia nitens TaxID=1686743 RepID=UPI0023DA8ABF